MSETMTMHKPTPLRDLLPGAPAEGAPRTDAISSQPTSGGFAALLAAYRSSGGTARGDDLARLLQDRLRGGCISLAKHISCGDVFGFEWRRTLWIPMFQFDLRDLSVTAEPRLVLHELANKFDGWSLATWFAQGNSWLGGRRPVDVLGVDLPTVLNAARADRIVVQGLP